MVEIIDPEKVQKETQKPQKKNVAIKSTKTLGKGRIKKKNYYFDDYFIKNRISYIDYKDDKTLRMFLNRQGRIILRTFNKLTSRNQRLLVNAIKRARQMALLPYTIVNQNE